MELFDVKIEVRKGIKNKIIILLDTLGEFASLLIQILNTLLDLVFLLSF